MPQFINWLDIAIAAALVLTLLLGIRAGLIRSIFNIAGVAAGLILAFRFFEYMSTLLLSFTSMSKFIADFVSFVVIFSFAAVAFHLLGSFLTSVKGFKSFKLIDRIGGSAAGLAVGLAIISIILVFLTAFPIFAEFQELFDRSYLAPPIVEAAYGVYGQLSEQLPMSEYPDKIIGYVSSLSGSPDHNEVGFVSLDGATCFVCQEPVEFIGFFNQKGSVYPKFVCTGCGRTSHGCQTYEGYHEMFDRCPVELGNRGYHIDCEIWPNYDNRRPGGTCTVCGTEAN